MAFYIWQRPTWPSFTWDYARVAALLARARYEQGFLLGRLQMVDEPSRQDAARRTLANELAASAALEASAPSGDAVAIFSSGLPQLEGPLTPEILGRWHRALYPEASEGWRSGPSSPGLATLPPAETLNSEVDAFLTWFNAPPGKDATDPVIKAAIGHLWWMVLQPFPAGNVVIASLLTQMLLARAENTTQRVYSLSAQMLQERAAYELGLERTQRLSVDITAWLLWFLGCFTRALQSAPEIYKELLEPASLSQPSGIAGVNERQRSMIVKLRKEGGSTTTTRWAQHASCSQDSAYRDILDLIAKNILRKEASGGRSTRYSLVAP